MLAHKISQESLPLFDAYQELVEQGWQPDAPQSIALTALSNLLKALKGEGSIPPKGVYLYGPVGRGKSKLLEMFMQHLPKGLTSRRVHMHAFMQEVHRRIGAIEKGDPLKQLAEELAGEAQVFGFDEFYITNIADAMLLGRLFQFLFTHKVVVVATSNWPPEDLFQNGLNRDRFTPFLKLIKTHLDAVDLSGGPDYRAATRKGWSLYHVGKSKDKLAEAFKSYANGKTEKLPAVVKATKHQGRCAWFTFEELCENPLGRTEYLALIRTVDTLMIENVPVLEASDADAALRFVTLVDIMYDHKRRLVLSAADYPENLCPSGVASGPFLRAASRLSEMQSWQTAPQEKTE
ncbi:MAG: cell division protein ZapE [Alphaproteobacteria bacterium CG_4_10_14_0_8_um_filter_53_9]|nr:MAG: cell division protein ZapE [Alphaproteobacteria bacterium CG_4_10_14_0_8_um_filter_53_9]